MSEKKLTEIEYERTTAGITRRQGRLLIFLLFLNTALLGTYVAGPQLIGGIKQQWNDWVQRRADAKKAQQDAALKAQQHQKLLATQNQFLSFQFPPDTVIFEEDPTIAAAAMISGKGYRPVRANSLEGYLSTWQPPVLAPTPPLIVPLSGYFYSPPDGVLLVHERHTPGGDAKLVCVTVEAMQQGIQAEDNSNDRRVVNEIQLTAVAFQPIAASSDTVSTTDFQDWKRQGLKLLLPREANTMIRYQSTGGGRGRYDVKPGMYFKLLAGTTDPKDPTHFTIPYKLGTDAGTIDGWLRDDGIELRGREGQMGPQSSWILPTPAKK